MRKQRRWSLSRSLELEQAKNERDRLLDALGDAFLIVDQGANIRFANAAAQKLFSGRSLIGRRFVRHFWIRDWRRRF